LLLITGVLCLAIGVLATVLGPRRITRIKETRSSAARPPRRPAFAPFGQILPGCAALHRLRHRERVHLPAGALLRDPAREGLGWFAYFEMLSFMVTLAIGLLYVWRKGALESIRERQQYRFRW